MQVLYMLLLYIYLKFLFRLNYSVLMGYYSWQVTNHIVKYDQIGNFESYIDCFMLTCWLQLCCQWCYTKTTPLLHWSEDTRGSLGSQAEMVNNANLLNYLQSHR